MMLELTTTFTPADGSAPRTITLRISDVRPDPGGHSWSAAIEVLGFKNDDRLRVRQVDWTNAIKDGMNMIARRVTDQIELAGGGTLDPPIHPSDWPDQPAAKPQP
jgi:hypothetical protein